MRPVIFSDFDGTITRLDVTDEIFKKFADPSWREVERAWRQGAMGSRECLERQMALVHASSKQLKALIDEISLDPGLPAFYQFVKERGLPFYILSDGFDYVIRRVMKRAGAGGDLRNGRHLFASTMRLTAGRVQIGFPHSKNGCAHGCATCKPAVIERLRRDRRPVVFVGDGLSDRFAVAAADVVFAKGDLFDYCRKKCFACHRFETFEEVRAGLEPWLAVETNDQAAALTVA